MEALFFRFFKEVDARQLRLQRFEPGTLKHAPRVHAFRYIRIDFRARELFQNGGALIRQAPAGTRRSPPVQGAWSA